MPGYRNASSASLLRENLLRKDLVYSPRRGVVAFTVPLFAAYVREHHPLAGFEEQTSTAVSVALFAKANTAR